MTELQSCFGTESQQALLKRGRDLFDIIGDDIRFSYYGRTVGLVSAKDGGVARLAALARLQGNSNIATVPDADMLALSAEAEDAGLSTVHYARLSGGADACSAARAIIADTPLPDGLTSHWLGPDSAPEIVAAFADVALINGVLPPVTDVMTGLIRKGTARVVVDDTGQGVSCAASAAFLAPGHPIGLTECWWGMLATRPSHRGARLSLRIGAEVLLAMSERHGFTRFFTGVEPGNRPSEVVCARMGLQAEGRAILGAADATPLPGGRMTK